MSNQKQRVAVIGAGPSGLAACKVLREHGYSITCYEAGDRVGGQWVIQNTSGSSGCYRSVVTNTHKGMIRYSDFEPDPGLPDFPGHRQMADYFERYAEHFDLFSDIELCSRVVRVERLAGGRWQVATDRGTGGDFAALVVCVGRYGSPNMPTFAGAFGGELIHAQQYMDPETPVNCRDRNVLIVGLGNTACDLAVELASPGAAKRVVLSARSGAHIIPRRPNGQLAPAPHPADPLPSIVRHTPQLLRGKLMQALLPMVFKRLQRGQVRADELGLPHPTQTPNPTNIVANDKILEYLDKGQIQARPAVRKLHGDEVEFVDGARDKIDVIIAATGYDVSLPFLDPERCTGVRELKLYRGIMDPKQHNLYFVGMLMGLCSNWPFSEQQAIWVAKHLSGRIDLPDERRLLERSESPADMSRRMLNCQFAADELRRDYR